MTESQVSKAYPNLNNVNFAGRRWEELLFGFDLTGHGLNEVSLASADSFEDLKELLVQQFGKPFRVEDEEVGGLFKLWFRDEKKGNLLSLEGTVEPISRKGSRPVRAFVTYFPIDKGF